MTRAFEAEYPSEGGRSNVGIDGLYVVKHGFHHDAGSMRRLTRGSRVLESIQRKIVANRSQLPASDQMVAGKDCDKRSLNAETTPDCYSSGRTTVLQHDKT
jgi:hypothetical protein